jgi:hypothetical protein
LRDNNKENSLQAMGLTLQGTICQKILIWLGPVFSQSYNNYYI